MATLDRQVCGVRALMLSNRRSDLANLGMPFCKYESGAYQTDLGDVCLHVGGSIKHQRAKEMTSGSLEGRLLVCAGFL